MLKHLFTDDMKQKRIMLPVILLMFCFCSQGESNDCRKENGDIYLIEGKETDLGYGKESLYFAVKDNDTLNICIDMIDFNNSDFVDISLKEVYNNQVTYGTTYFDYNKKESKNHIRSTYRQQMQIIDGFLKLKSSKGSFKRIRCLEIPLLTSGELNLEICETLKCSDVETAVQESSLMTNLNNVLRRYNYKITEKPRVDKYVYVSEDSFRKSNMMDSIPSLRGLKRFVDCYVTFSLDKL